MNRRHLILAMLGAASAAALAAPPARKPPPKPPKERVVIQVSDAEPKRWNVALSVAKSLIREYEEDKIIIEIVAFGPGVNMLKSDSDVANRITNALGRGILVTASAEGLRAHNVDEEDLVKNVTVVPSGPAHILQRQRQGWLYLKP